MRDFETSREHSNNRKSNEYLLPVKEMYPDQSPDEQAEAEFYLTQYFEVIHSIFEEKYNLTNSGLNATVKGEK